MRWWRRLQRAESNLIILGAGLVLAAVLDVRASIGGAQLGPGASWWQRVMVIAAGLGVVVLALVRAPGEDEELWSSEGFLGAPPVVSNRLVERAELTREVVGGLRASGRPVGLVGIGGAGKSTVAALVCRDRQVRRTFTGGITWLDAGRERDPVALLTGLGRRLGLGDRQSTFASAAQARDRLAASLRDRRLLLVVDNVWDRDVLDAVLGLVPAGALLFTTRSTELASVVDALQIWVDELTQQQALQLLDRWAGGAAGGSADEARALCTRVGNLALAVAMAGAMVANGRTYAAVRALVEDDLRKVRADLSQYPYRTLVAAIEAGITDLDDDDRVAYERLVVFAGRRNFPREAACALWGMSRAAADDLLVRFSGRSLLTVVPPESNTKSSRNFYAHDLQYEVLRWRQDADKITEAHARLLGGYRDVYPGSWAESAKDSYLADALAGHLAEADQGEELHRVLTDLAWIQVRVASGKLPGLIADYRYSTDLLTDNIRRALRQSAATLASDPTQTRGHLVGRLLRHPDSKIAAWANDQSRSRTGTSPWLVPLTPALTQSTGALEFILADHTGAVFAVAVTADGDRAVSGGADGIVRVWDLITGIPKCLDDVGRMHSVAVTSDGTRALSGGEDGIVQVWDLTTGTHKKLAGHAGRVLSVAVTSDGTRAVSGGADGTVRVWDLTTGTQWKKLTGHVGLVRTVAVTPDGNWAISGGFDEIVRIWNLVDGELPVELEGHTGILSVALTADGTRAISGGFDRMLRVWDLTVGTHLQLAGHTQAVQSVAVTHDGTWAVSGGADGTVRGWDLTTGAQLGQVTADTKGVWSVAVTASGFRAVSAGEDGTVRAWDLTRCTRPSTLIGPLRSIAFIAEGTRAVSGGDDGVVRVWDLTAGAEEAQLTDHIGAVDTVAVTPDGSRAVSGGADGTVWVWDLTTGTHEKLADHVGRVHSVAVTPEGTRAVSGGADGILRVWDLTTGALRGQFAAHDGPVLSVAVTADGSWAVSGGRDGTVLRWDLTTVSQQAPLVLHLRRMPMGTVDRADAVDDGEAETVPGRRHTPGAGRSSVNSSPRVCSVAVTSDGTRAASGDSQGMVRVWDLTTPNQKELLSFKDHRGCVRSVALAQDGRYAVTCGDDRMVRVRDLNNKIKLVRWDDDEAVIACTVMSVRPLRVGIGTQNRMPYILELRDMEEP